ncbi:OmpA family protein [Roseobacter sp. CCS2]|uniref:OmpA family protein n=1 Tax=Roseobacter sp. CCS2 TaxID=391593 RepID=UPI0000F4003B|nr:OmpA family protein [Roseobacter sp. CCS2]EBA13304.1 OmpA family protein [Roseobacter sp. CCS2]
MKYVITAAIAAATLSACSSADRQVGTASFFTEAGSALDAGDFGEATMNNRLVQTGAQDYTINLARRFAAEVNTTVNFAFNSTVLDADARSTLMRQADWIRQFPEVRFKVYGHTDLVGSQGYNRSLGLRRAQAAVAFLASQGINRNRLEAVVSFGETQPLVVTDGRERRNRRTVTEVTGFVESDPLVLNGKYAEIIFRDYVQSASQQVTTSAGEFGG